MPADARGKTLRLKRGLFTALEAESVADRLRVAEPTFALDREIIVVLGDTGELRTYIPGVKLTQEEYDALPAVHDDTAYFITAGGGAPLAPFMMSPSKLQVPASFDFPVVSEPPAEPEPELAPAPTPAPTLSRAFIASIAVVSSAATSVALTLLQHL